MENTLKKSRKFEAKEVESQINGTLSVKFLNQRGQNTGIKKKNRESVKKQGRKINR